ncbi:MAG: hypothetical protein P8Y47_03470, partial [Alphaproteobacteria bacterium]
MDGDCSALDELMVVAASREPLYSRARAVLDTSERSVDENAQTLQNLIERYCEAYCPWVDNGLSIGVEKPTSV